MGKIYDRPTYNPGPQSVPLEAGGSYPIDIREVVDTYASLIDPTTWGVWEGIPGIFGYWNFRCYEGMRVTVVRDTNPSLNGVYYLKNNHYVTHYTDQNISLANDWEKIGSSVTLDQYTLKDGTDTYLSGDVQQSGVHVVRVDGGEY